MLTDKGQRGRYLDAPTCCFDMGTVYTPVMVDKIVGAGSQYAILAVDRNSAYLDGGKNCKRKIPVHVLAKDFWSVVVDALQTRSQLQTGQPFPAKHNRRYEIDVNRDGSADFDFRAKAPVGRRRTEAKQCLGKTGSVACA